MTKNRGFRRSATPPLTCPPVPGRHRTLGRDHEYKRHGTLSLLAGIDLLSGEVLGLVRDRHRSAEFVEFLQLADQHYPPGARIRLVLDNHSAHISRETRAYLAGVPNRFDFVFTPKHGSWLNLVESFFGKLAKTLLRGIACTRNKSCRLTSNCICRKSTKSRSSSNGSTS